MTEPDWNRYPNFTRGEFVCQCGCALADMDPGFMARLQALRTAVGEPLSITSGFRCQDHNAAVSKTGRTGPHTTGQAADIRCYGQLAWDVLDEATNLGFSGIGLRQTGQITGRFIHLDTLPEATGRPRPTIWTY